MCVFEHTTVSVNNLLTAKKTAPYLQTKIRKVICAAACSDLRAVWDAQVKFSPALADVFQPNGAWLQNHVQSPAWWFQKISKGLLSQICYIHLSAFSLGATWLGDLCPQLHAASSIEPGIDVTQFNLSVGAIRQRITVGCQWQKSAPPSVELNTSPYSDWKPDLWGMLGRRGKVCWRGVFAHCLLEY